MKRARTSEQKQQRRELILESALTVFQTTKYEEITLDAVAKVAELGKATLYSYFVSREELFMALCQELLEAWFVQVHQQLGTLSAPATAAQVAAAITEILPQHLDLIRLFPLMYSTFQRNVRPEAWLAYKQWFVPRIMQSNALFAALLPNIARGERQPISRYMYMLMMGMTQMPDDDQHDSQRDSQIGMPISWLNDFRTAFTILLTGMERSNQ